ncbi:MAG: response regulator transcription factor [Deltaproteobacteria bacterium]|nr:response regulator transcription factor [Deltaproteobacteria bacterium]
MGDAPGAARVLVVEDDPSILLGLRLNLEAEGYRVGTAEDGVAGLERARTEGWDIIILDVMLPKLNGYELLGSLRAARIPTPVLVLSARSSEVDKVMGLDLGAADYLTKPFSVPELLARVRAVLRRHAAAPQVWTFGTVVVDADRREVRKAGRSVDLSATEFGVLLALVRAAGRTMSREQIFDAVWGAGHHGTHRTIDNFVAQLRAKLEEDPLRPAHLLTVRGVGYRLVP